MKLDQSPIQTSVAWVRLEKVKQLQEEGWQAVGQLVCGLDLSSAVAGDCGKASSAGLGRQDGRGDTCARGPSGWGSVLGVRSPMAVVGAC